jgi:hypothetical protein
VSDDAAWLRLVEANATELLRRLQDTRERIEIPDADPHPKAQTPSSLSCQKLAAGSRGALAAQLELLKTSESLTAGTAATEVSWRTRAVAQAAAAAAVVAHGEGKLLEAPSKKKSKAKKKKPKGAGAEVAADLEVHRHAACAEAAE